MATVLVIIIAIRKELALKICPIPEEQPIEILAPQRRLGKPSEIGDAVVWPGSDLSSYVTGIALLVDGGLLSVI
jgi:NAD(P)-dependent dehydrogenase (short-subunit alcohol dehydrogenase family)